VRIFDIHYNEYLRTRPAGERPQGRHGSGKPACKTGIKAKNHRSGRQMVAIWLSGRFFYKKQKPQSRCGSGVFLGAASQI